MRSTAQAVSSAAARSRLCLSAAAASADQTTASTTSGPEFSAASLWSAPLTVTNGVIDMSDEPGFGFHIDRDAIKWNLEHQDTSTW